jgi:chaperonin GroES
MVLKRDTAATHTKAGLELPNGATEAPMTGVILAIGPDSPDYPGAGDLFSVGDRVLFDRYGGEDIKIAGESYVLVSARSIKAVLNTTEEVVRVGNE